MLPAPVLGKVFTTVVVLTAGVGVTGVTGVTGLTGTVTLTTAFSQPL